jgi:hypothetical protein
MIKYNIEKINNKWLVRPENCAGTCGWHPYAWNAILVKANTKENAFKKAYPQIKKQRGLI